MKKVDRCGICSRRLKKYGCKTCGKAYRMGFDRAIAMSPEDKTKWIEQEGKWVVLRHDLAARGDATGTTHSPRPADSLGGS